MNSGNHRRDTKRREFPLTPNRLVICGLLSWVIYGIINHLSPPFAYDVPATHRPLRWVLTLLAVNFAIYLISLRLALRQSSVTVTIITFALAFRLVMLPSEPIQEIDIYRYIWDGVASRYGVSPFQFSPQQVLEADQAASDNPQLAALVKARDSSPGIHTSLSRVHFGHLPTVYPPTSQVVFAMAAWTTPGDASVSTRLIVMKLWLLLFDLGTIAMIAAILRHVGLHAGWLLAYAWCPLVLKEFANSGHLDSIAVFFCSTATYLAMRGLFSTDGRPHMTSVLAAFSVLALGVAAKLYPIVLVPLLAWTTWQRLGLPKAMAAVGLWAISAVSLMAPMLIGRHAPSQQPVVMQDDRSPAEAVQEIEPPAESIGDPRAGLRAFLSSWIMNDFIFLNVIENVTPDAHRDGATTPWFVFVPDGWRDSATQRVAKRFDVDTKRVPFLIARSVTATVFVGLALYWAGRASRCASARDWNEYIFLTLAWFWLLLPTLNPWYWIWVLPWIPFARNRTWLWMSGLVLMYYLRFYFAAHYAGRPVVSFLPYHGEPFFDFMVVWAEYFPWFVCLIVTSVLRRRNRIDPDAPSGGVK